MLFLYEYHEYSFASGGLSIVRVAAGPKLVDCD